MNCLVTGGAGFIGSHLVDALIKKGYKVLVVDDLSTGKLTNVHQGSKFYKLKIEAKRMEKVFEENRPDIVFHLAAQSQVKKSMDDPLLDARTNILGTLNLLVLSLKYKVTKFIFASSGGVIYGNTEKPATEDSPSNPFSAYGISKMTAEEYIKFYSKFGLNYTILRYSNVYGPRQDPNGEAGVVAIWTKHMLSNEPCILYGFGKLVRDYVYVEDAVRANIRAMGPTLCGSENQTLNIGTGVPTSVEELFKKMSHLARYSVSPVYKPKREGEVEINYLNCAKAKNCLSWEPEVSLEEGLRKTINWFKQVGGNWPKR